MKPVRCNKLLEDLMKNQNYHSILSTTAIASGIVLTSVSSAACPLREYRTSPEQSSQVNWLPLVAA